MSSNLDLPGKEAPRSSQVDLSPFATVVAFDPILPLARVPVPAGRGDDPSKGPFVLAFRNEDTWRQAWRSCRDKIATQCDAGAKVGCSIAAAKACGPPWWKLYFPFLFPGGNDQSKREECEEREMQGCLVSSQERCSRYARETCDPAFANMRIAVPGVPIDRRFNGKPLRRPRVTRHDKLVAEAESPGLPNGAIPQAAQLEEDRPSVGVTTFRGRLLMQNERGDECEKSMPNWSSHGHATPLHQPLIPQEGWVGGLVHPAPRTDGQKDDPGSKHTIRVVAEVSAPEWWQQFQQSVMEKLAREFGKDCNSGRH